MRVRIASNPGSSLSAVRATVAPPFANASIALSCFTSFMCELGIPAYPLSSLALRSQFFCYESFAAASLVRPFVVFVVRLRVVLFRFFFIVFRRALVKVSILWRMVFCRSLFPSAKKRRKKKAKTGAGRNTVSWMVTINWVSQCMGALSIVF